MGEVPWNICQHVTAPVSSRCESHRRSFGASRDSVSVMAATSPSTAGRAVASAPGTACNSPTSVLNSTSVGPRTRSAGFEVTSSVQRSVKAAQRALAFAAQLESRESEQAAPATTTPIATAIDRTILPPTAQRIELEVGIPCPAAERRICVGVTDYLDGRRATSTEVVRVG